MFAAAHHDAPHRTDVGIVAAPGYGDVIASPAQAVVGGIEIDPVESGDKHGDPGVRSFRADAVLPASDVATDIARGQTHGAQTGNHDLGEILADAAPQCKRRQDRRVDLGGLGNIAESVVDAAAEV